MGRLNGLLKLCPSVLGYLVHLSDKVTAFNSTNNAVGLVVVLL